MLASSSNFMTKGKNKDKWYTSLVSSLKSKHLINMNDESVTCASQSKFIAK